MKVIAEQIDTKEIVQITAPMILILSQVDMESIRKYSTDETISHHIVSQTPPDWTPEQSATWVQSILKGKTNDK